MNFQFTAKTANADVCLCSTMLRMLRERVCHGARDAGCGCNTAGWSIAAS